MTEEQIIEMARQAGAHDNGYEVRFVEPKYLERFAKLVAQHEREEWEVEFAGMGEWACVYLLQERNK